MIDKDYLIDLRRNAYIECTQNYLQFDNVIGVFGTNIPLEIFYAFELTPVPIEGVDAHIFQYGEESNVCDVIRSTLIYLKTQKCPILYSCGMYVVSRHCELFHEKIKESTEKNVVYYVNEEQLKKELTNNYKKQFSPELKKQAEQDLQYIESVLQKIENYSTVPSEEVFLLRYFTPYIISLSERRKYFEQLETEIIFTKEKLNYKKKSALCPRGAYENIFSELKESNTRVFRGWGNSDYGYKDCPFKHKKTVSY